MHMPTYPLGSSGQTGLDLPHQFSIHPNSQPTLHPMHYAYMPNMPTYLQNYVGSLPLNQPPTGTTTAATATTTENLPLAPTLVQRQQLQQQQQQAYGERTAPALRAATKHIGLICLEDLIINYRALKATAATGTFYPPLATTGTTAATGAFYPPLATTGTTTATSGPRLDLPLPHQMPMNYAYYALPLMPMHYQYAPTRMHPVNYARPPMQYVYAPTGAFWSDNSAMWHQ